MATDDTREPIPPGDREQAHHIICGLKTIVGRVLYGSDNDEGEMEDLCNQADAWVKSYREARHAGWDPEGPPPSPPRTLAIKIAEGDRELAINLRVTDTELMIEG